jgi:hypothetical protein
VRQAGGLDPRDRCLASTHVLRRLARRPTPRRSKVRLAAGSRSDRQVTRCLVGSYGWYRTTRRRRRRWIPARHGSQPVADLQGFDVCARRATWLALWRGRRPEVAGLQFPGAFLRSPLHTDGARIGWLPWNCACSLSLSRGRRMLTSSQSRAKQRSVAFLRCSARITCSYGIPFPE